jgi:hypothetical protein
MIRFSAILEKFGQQGEKTGWTYIRISQARAQQLMPGQKKAFRVKGKLDAHAFSLVSLMPMGDGNFIMVVNAAMRKAIRKQKGATVEIQMQVDKTEIKPPAALLECLEDEPEALQYFYSLAKGHQNYFTHWINSAKTEPTKAKRIAATINALIKKFDFGQMVRSMKKDREI